MKGYLLLSITLFYFSAYAQTQNAANDTAASGLLQRVSEKYKAYNNISANFKLLTVRPKLKPEEDDRKYTDTLTGQIILAGKKFNISIKSQQIICNGKDIWTYSGADKEVQINYFDEGDDIFSPSKIFSLYKSGYLYQVKEKRPDNGKTLTVIEMAPPNKKLTYFKIDVAIDPTTLQIIESKIYEKNGVRYIYRLTKQTPNTPLNEDAFNFDVKKHPGVKVDDLR